MFNHTPRHRRLVYGMAYLTLAIGFSTLLLIGGFYWYQKTQSNISCEEWMMEAITPLAYEAVITRVTEEKKCQYRVELDIDTPDYLSICQCPAENNLAEWIGSGDSIFKKTGEMTLTFKRENTSRVFDYPCCE